MNFLTIKNAFKQIFSLKYFWIYLFLFATVATISNIFQSAKNIPNYNLISSVISFLSYISLGYLFVVIHDILNNNSTENENENFWSNLINSSKKGFKCLLGIILNILTMVAVGLVLLGTFVFCEKILTKLIFSATHSFKMLPLIVVVSLIIGFIIITSIVISLFVPVAFAEKYSFKDMFKWNKIFKTFFQKDFRKRTLFIFGIYILGLIAIFGSIFGVMFFINAFIIYFAKTLLEEHFVAIAILINLSNVLTPFLVAGLNYILSGGIFVLLANIYKESLNTNELQDRING